MLPRRGAQCAPGQRKIIRGVGEQCSPLRDRLYRPKNIFSELITHGQFFYIIRRIDEGRSYASQGECSSASAGVRTNRRRPEPMKLLHRTEQNTALLGINRAYSHAHRFFSSGKRDFSSGKRHFSSGKSTEQRRAEERTEEQSIAEDSRADKIEHGK